MKVGPRVQLVLIAAIFALPIVASVIAYLFVRPAPTANYGELLLPPALVTDIRFDRQGGGSLSLRELAGQWILVTSDSGACPPPCIDKLLTLRQVRLALGRNASRVERVFVVDDGLAPGPDALAPFEGTVVASMPRGLALPHGAAGDRSHIYLVDPHGNVMMRWPGEPDPKRMLRDLELLLKASQIG